MKSRLWQKRAALFLLVVYSIDLAWKIADWREVFGGVDWWGIALGLTVRFAFMGFVLSIYLRLRKIPEEPTVVTKAMKKGSVRSMRIVHLVMLAAVAIYAFVAERWLKPASIAPTELVETLSIVALTMVVIAIVLRRKLLPSAIDEPRNEAGDAKALGRWRIANILSMVLALTIALYGLVLRALGSTRAVVRSFFIASFILMLLWRPRLDEGTDGTVTLPPSKS